MIDTPEPVQRIGIEMLFLLLHLKLTGRSPNLTLHTFRRSDREISVSYLPLIIIPI